METVDGRFERTDEIEVPRSRAESCLLHAYGLPALQLSKRNK